MEVRHETFIEASDSIGCTTRRIVTVHVVPNVLSPLLIVVAVSFGSAILAEAGLTYIGLGTRPPTSSWGGMLLDAAGHLHQRYLAWAPGLALLFTVAAFLVLGDATRDLVAARRTTS
jgi:peptide/nickel transport system permease protein